MIEYRTEKVLPQNEENITNILSVFGWIPVNSQEVYNESTELVGVEVKTYGDGLLGGFMQGWTGSDGSIKVKQRKNVTNYVSLKFARDTNMPEYSRLKELNEEFESKLVVAEPKKPIKRTVITAVGVLIIVISVIMAIANGTPAAIWEILVCVFFPVIMIPVTVIGWVFYKRKLKYYDTVQWRLNELYDEALKITG